MTRDLPAVGNEVLKVVTHHRDAVLRAYKAYEKAKADALQDHVHTEKCEGTITAEYRMSLSEQEGS